MGWKAAPCNGITWNGKYYTEQEIRSLAVKDLPPFKARLVTFLKEWWDDSPLLTVQTSGSTGAPTLLRVEKKRMIYSAQRTCSFLGLHKGDRALLCMPLEYIAGKMMVIRALVKELDLITSPPSSHPFAPPDLPSLELAALVPLQVYHSLAHELEKEKLQSVRHLLIGGGGLDCRLEKQLHDFPHFVWSTYGMTETLTHIALRRINGKDASAWYTPLEDVSVSLSAQETLIIEAPGLSPEKIVTNDRVELKPDGRFCVLGRIDNVICSGGLKVQIEEVEKILHPFLSVPFAVSWVTDSRLGQRVVLLLEVPSKKLIPPHLEAAFERLASYQRPRHILYTAVLPRTETDKPARCDIQILCEKLLKNRGTNG